jgi:23S rRNA (uracil1939-C5)-methyltransferase
VRGASAFVIVAPMPAPLHKRRRDSSGSARPRGRKTGAARVEKLRVESVAAGGAGVARLEGGAVVFIPGTAQGDLVEAEVQLDARPLRGKLLRVLERGPGRSDPPCAFVASCGGCDFMHLTAAAQEAAHAAIVKSAIQRATSLERLPCVRVHAAPAALGYRTRARLFARAQGGRARVGYRAAGTHDLAAIDACVVLHPSIAGLLGELPDVLQGARGEGDVLIARGAGDRPVVELHWKGELAASTWARVDERVTAGAWAGARVLLAGAAKPASFGDPRAWMEGADGQPLLIAPGGFAQPSDEGARMLAQRVAELATLATLATLTTQDAARASEGGAPAEAPGRPLHTVELFAGSGTLSVLLARHAASFTAVEVDEEAVACARQNFAARGLSGKHVVADANAYPIPPRAELVVLDPPRAGAPAAARAIAASSARVVVYVACDPATLARDLAALTAKGFGITDIETFELFPQTSHVEAVVRLAKRPRAAG